MGGRWWEPARLQESDPGQEERAEKTGGGGRLGEGGRPIEDGLPEDLPKSWGHGEGFALPQAVELSDSEQFYVVLKGGSVFDPVVKVIMQTKEREVAANSALTVLKN